MDIKLQILSLYFNPILMRIALYGFMGAGKSSLGQKLAKQIGYDFKDLDALIETYTGKTINDIFSSEGEIAFRRIEHLVLKNFIRENQENVVLALGGGSILQPTNRKLLELKNFYKIYINVDIYVLTERLKKNKNNRPLLKDLKESEFDDYIKALFESRRNIYEKHADLNFKVGHESFERTLERLYNYLNVN